MRLDPRNERPVEAGGPGAREADLRKLGALKSDCGCVAGMLVLLPSMAAYARHFLFAHADRYSRAEKILAGCIVFFASAAMGKLSGILIARLRAWILERRLAKAT
jgi:hypothetical protein